MSELLIPFAIFIIAMTGTPGPGNMTMMAIGQTTGFRSAVPFLIGTTIGFASLNLLVSLGLGEAFKQWGWLALTLKFGGAAYILYLAYKLFKLQAAPPETIKQFTISEGLFLHPLSPKSWAMSIAAYSQFFALLPVTAETTALFVLPFMIGQFTFHSMWCGLGAGLYNSLKNPQIRLMVNSSLVLLMLGATFYALTT